MIAELLDARECVGYHRLIMNVPLFMYPGPSWAARRRLPAEPLSFTSVTCHQVAGIACPSRAVGPL